MKKAVIFILAAIILLSSAFSAYLLISNLRLRKSLKEMPSAGTEGPDSPGVPQSQIRKDIQKSLDEKYRADMVSYRAMINRLEREKTIELKQEAGK
jgi:hypothetical protein